MKQVLFDLNNEHFVNFQDATLNKMYAFVSGDNKIYILKMVGKRLAWVSFDSVDAAWNGAHFDIKIAMQSVSDRIVFEFSRRSEFEKWLKETI